MALIVGQLLNASVTEIVVGSGSDRAGYTYRVNALGAVTTGSGGLFAILEQRLTGAFGEPGAFASILAITGCLALSNDKRWRVSVQLPLLTALLLTQSIAGVSIYAVGLSVFLLGQMVGASNRRVRPRHYLATAGGIIAAVYLAANEVGPLGAKRTANEISLTARTSGTSPSELLTSWVQFPLGVLGESPDRAINLVQASLTMGPLIMIAGLWLYLAPLRGPRGLAAAPVVAATVTTALFSQPPFLYSWIFFAFVGWKNGYRACDESSARHDDLQRHSTSSLAAELQRSRPADPLGWGLL